MEKQPRKILRENTGSIAPVENVKTESPAISRQKALTRKSVKILIATVGISLVLHEPAYHPELEDAYDKYLLQPYNEWKKARERRNAVEQMEQQQPELAEALKEDQAAVEDRNLKRKQRIEERKDETAQYKAYLREHYGDTEYSDIYFKIEYLSQGMEQEEVDTAKEFFAIKSDGIKLSEDTNPRSKILHLGLREIVAVFMPPDSYEPTKTSAVGSLVEELGPESQNCVARTRLMVMAIATKYPQFKKNIYVQVFRDHQRALVEIGGKRFILEGSVASFPDQETKEKRSEVVPFDVWLALYAGVDRKGLEGRIEKYGPKGKAVQPDYARVTDNLVDDFYPTSHLDNVGTAEAWFNSRHKTKKPDKPGDANMSVDQPKVQNELLIEDISLTPADIDRIMTVDALKEGGDFTKQIIFSNLREIDVPTAKKIAEKTAGHSNMNIHFRALKKISKEAAIELAQAQISIIFESFASLPLALAEGLTNRGYRTDFRNLKMISAEAAAALVGPKIGVTQFFDINDLLPADADSSFDVNPNAGTVQQMRRRGYLGLQGLVGLSDDAARELVRYEGSIMFEDANLSKSAGEIFSKAKYRIGLRRVPAEFIEGLAIAENGPELQIFDDIDLPIAQAAGKYKGSLDLENNNAMDMNIAVALSRHKGPLKMFGLKLGQNIDSDELHYLALNEGPITLGSLTGFRPELVPELAKNKYDLEIHFGGSITPEIARELAAKKTGNIILRNLNDIDNAALEELAKCKCGLSLDFIPTMEQARILARHSGELSLNALTALPVEMARVLAQHRGSLTLSAIKTLSYASAEEILKIPGKLIMHGFVLKSRKMQQIFVKKYKRYGLMDTSVVIDDLSMMRLNAPDRDWKWEEQD